MPTYLQPLKAWADMSMPPKAIEASSGMTGYRPWVELDINLSRSLLTYIDPETEPENEVPDDESDEALPEVDPESN